MSDAEGIARRPRPTALLRRVATRAGVALPPRPRRGRGTGGSIVARAWDEARTRLRQAVGRNAACRSTGARASGARHSRRGARSASRPRCANCIDGAWQAPARPHCSRAGCDADARERWCDAACAVARREPASLDRAARSKSMPQWLARRRRTLVREPTRSGRRRTSTSRQRPAWAPDCASAAGDACIDAHGRGPAGRRASASSPSCSPSSSAGRGATDGAHSHERARITLDQRPGAARARATGPFSVYEALAVGPRRLLGEVIQLRGDELVAQVYEDTTGLEPGDDGRRAPASRCRCRWARACSAASSTACCGR